MRTIGARQAHKEGYRVDLEPGDKWAYIVTKPDGTTVSCPVPNDHLGPIVMEDVMIIEGQKLEEGRLTSSPPYAGFSDEKAGLMTLLNNANAWGFEYGGEDYDHIMNRLAECEDTPEALREFASTTLLPGLA